MTTKVDAFVDPGCPWSWMASRWLKAAAAQRDLHPRWRSFSVQLRDGGRVGADLPQTFRALAVAAHHISHRLLRIFESVRDVLGEEAVDRLYGEWGSRFFAEGTSCDDRLLAECLFAAGLDDDFLTAADDSRWDEPIREAMELAYAFGGRHTRTPTIVVYSEPPHGFTGPIMASAPTGEAAARVWDAIQIMGREPGFFGITRPRPIVPPAISPIRIRRSDNMF
jgi:hypothetical protein